MPGCASRVKAKPPARFPENNKRDRLGGEVRNFRKFTPSLTSYFESSPIFFTKFYFVVKVGELSKFVDGEKG